MVENYGINDDMVMLLLIYLIRCKSYEKAKKKLTILEAPNILTIALKRFQASPLFQS